MTPFTREQLDEAVAIVRAAMPPTPQYAWPLLGQAIGAEVWVKHENHTPTGAFKVRGGLVFMEHLRRDRPHVRGVISATRGNHGQSIAFAGRAKGVTHLRALRWPEGAKPERLQARGWIEAADGSLLAVAAQRCP